MPLGLVQGLARPQTILATGARRVASSGADRYQDDALLQVIREAVSFAGRDWQSAGSPLARQGLQTVLGGFMQLTLAILITILGASLTVVGMMVQKLAHQKAEAEELDLSACDRPVVAGCASTRWLLGLACFGLGNLVTWVALGLAPNSVLACFNSWNIVFAMVVAPLWLGENVVTGARRSAALLMMGCVWVTCSGPRSYRLETVESINLLFTKLPFTICTIALLAILVVVRLRIVLWNRSRGWKPHDSLQITFSAAIFGTYAVLFAKCTSVAVESSVLGNSDAVAQRWQLYLWAGLVLVFGFMQIHFLNESLRHGKASFVIPAYQSMSMALQIVVGGIFFREYAQFSLQEHLQFWPAVALVVFGVIALTRCTQLQEQDPCAKTDGTVTCLEDESPMSGIGW